MLIKCPECGKEKVSDSAEACPDCGYGIKAHIDLENQLQQKSETAQKELNMVAMPSEPKYQYSSLILPPIIGLCGFVFGTGFGTIFFAIWVIVGITAMISNYKRDMEKYNLALENFDQYQKEEVAKRNRLISEEKTIKPECPYCHSHNSTKITTTTKVVNTAMFGIFGQKRKYQWHCNSCKSDF